MVNTLPRKQMAQLPWLLTIQRSQVRALQGPSMIRSLVVFRPVLSAFASAVLIATSLSVAMLAQSGPAAEVRAALGAAAREIVRDNSVIALKVADSVYAPAIAIFSKARRLAARRPFVASTATLRRWQVFGDSAYVDVDQRVVSSGPRAYFAERRLTLRRRAGRWSPVRWDVLGIP